MAGSISFFHKPPIAITNNLRLFPCLAILSPPSRHYKLAKRRRNTLRPKILTKPYSPPQNPRTTPTEPLETLSPPEEEQHEITVAAVSAESDAFPVDLSAGSLARYGLYLLVGFLFQTVLAVWVLGNSDSDRKDESLVVPHYPVREKMVLLNGTRNGIENLGEKVEEIRDLARKARKNEKNNNGDSKSRSKIGVQREVGNRLSKLRKSLDSSREKLPVSYVDSLNKFGSDSELKMEKENLIFKKKLGVKSSFVELGESPKGFGGSEKVAESEELDSEKLSLGKNGEKKFVGRKGFEEQNGETLSLKPNGSENNEEKMVENEGFGSEKLSLKQTTDEKKLVDPKEFVGSEKIEMSEKKMLIIDDEKLSSNKNVSKMAKNEGNDGEKMKFARNGRKKLASPKGFGGSEKSKGFRGKQRGERVVENGIVGVASEEENGLKKLQRKENETSPAMKLRNGVIQENRHKRSSESLSRDVTVTIDSDESSFLSRNGSMKLNKAKKIIGTDMWWLNLPCVLVVVMRRALDSEEISGLYTLTIDCSYIVAFEDRVDATNFSYLLEFFFEDLGDVSADIAPMSIKEVQEAMKSQDWNIFVVKKGQLKMYAGQPFEEVEMAIRALIEES